MAEGFFSQFFEETKPQERPQSPEAQVSKPKAPPPPPQTPTAQVGGAANMLEVRIGVLETELAKEKEKALTYELRLKEMENARGVVEEMFEKMWAKASKERLEEEMRMIRERALGRVDALEKRLDDFQKAFLDLIRDLGSTRKAQAAPSSAAGSFEGQVMKTMEELSALMKKLLEKERFEPKREQESGVSRVSADWLELTESLRRVDKLLDSAIKKK